eukprot:6466333-Amphidinium_carterae.1
MLDFCESKGAYAPAGAIEVQLACHACIKRQNEKLDLVLRSLGFAKKSKHAVSYAGAALGPSCPH